MTGVYRIGKSALHIAASLAVGAGCALLANSGARGFMLTQKPPFSPPFALFVYGWLPVAAAAGCGVALALREGARRNLLCALYYGQLGLGLIWSALFFGMGWHSAALIPILLQWILLSGAVFLFSFAGRWAPLLLLPNAFYVSCAAYLNMGAAILGR